MPSLLSENHLSTSTLLDSEQTLIERLRANSPNAWEALYELYSPMICRWARGNGVTCPHEQENIVQDVFTIVIKNIGSFERRRDRGSFPGWLYTITRNHIRSKRDSRLAIVGGSNWQRRLDEIPFPRISNSQQFDSASEIEQKQLDEKNKFVSAIFAWIDKRYKSRNRNKAVLKDLLMENKSAHEVAQDHNVTTNVIYQIKSRMVAQIREVFDAPE